MVQIRQAKHNLRVKELGKATFFCPYCKKKTKQTIYKHQPMGWITIMLIPLPYPSPNWDILINCNECNNLYGALLKDSIKNKVVDKFKDFKSSFKKRDFMVQIECCDICYFEQNKKMVPSKWRTKYSNRFINTCDEHKNWVKKQNFKNTKEILYKINSWYSQTPVKT